MSKLTEKINEIINEIDNNLSERLKRGRVEDLLVEIKTGLEILGKNAEEKYKKTVDEKVERLQEVIEKNLDEEPGWTKTQDDLSKIKKGLLELQDEIRKVEESLKVPTINEPKAQRNLFSLDVSKNVKDMVTTYVKAGTDASDIPILKEIGGIIGVGVAGYHGTIESAGAMTEKIINDSIDVGEHVFDVGAEITGKSMDIGAKMYEDTRLGAENVTKQVIGEGADITKAVVKNFDVLGAGENIAKTLTEGIGHTEEVKAKADSEARIAEANAKARIAEAELQAKMIELRLAQMEISKK